MSTDTKNDWIKWESVSAEKPKHDSLIEVEFGAPLGVRKCKYCPRGFSMTLMDMEATHPMQNVNLSHLTPLRWRNIKEQPKQSTDTYILLRDLPDGAIAGDEYKTLPNSNIYRNLRLVELKKVGHIFYYDWQVETNPTWFKKKEQPTEAKEQFVWDDDIALEFLNAHRTETQMLSKFKWKKESVEAFKKWKQFPPKEQPLSKDWEIVKISSGSFEEPNALFDKNIGSNLKQRKSKIHSVKRLSDGEVFTVGDEFYVYPGYNKHIIKSFRVEGNLIAAIDDIPYYIAHLMKKSKIITPSTNTDKPFNSNEDTRNKAIDDCIEEIKLHQVHAHDSSIPIFNSIIHSLKNLKSQ